MTHTAERGRISLFFVLVFLFLLALVPAGVLVVRMTDRAAPRVTVKTEAKAIGRKALVTVEAEEPKYGIRDVHAFLVQGSLSVPLGELTNPRNPWWRLWRRQVKPSALLEVEVGKGRAPELKEGPVTIRAEATNDSLAGFGKGRTTVSEVTIPVLLTPPRLEILSGQHYINQGGSECVVYRASETTAASGVRVGDSFFPGYPLPGAAAGTRFAFFAFPWNAPATTIPVVVARDAAENETTARFNYKLFPKLFRHETIHLTEDFLKRVVPEIQSQSQIASQGDLLKDFLDINGRLRRIDGAMLVELAGESKPETLWKGAFVQLGSSQVEAGFADHRSYEWQGKVVDQQDHLGYDLAVTAAHPVDAANDGVVALAKYFGIFGNTVVIDHGCSLMTLYAHLSSIDVKKGDEVKRGQAIGKSGATGLAGGDHLHFSVLLHGIPVNPVEWWDPHWIHDRIESKLAEGAGRTAPAAMTAAAAETAPAEARSPSHGASRAGRHRSGGRRRR